MKADLGFLGGKLVVKAGYTFRRVFLIVLDSVGIGALPDAASIWDEGTHTLRAYCPSDEWP